MLVDRQAPTLAAAALDIGNGAELLRCNGSAPLRGNQFAHFVNNIFVLAQLSFGIDLPSDVGIGSSQRTTSSASFRMAVHTI